MPFGLRNAGQSFQRFLDRVLAGLDFVFVYMDDILIASRTMEEHQDHVRQVMSRLQQHGLVINAEKCEWGLATVDYLGHRVTASGIRPLQDRVAATHSQQQCSSCRHI